jgi:general secretion pathway protein G
MSKDFGRAFTWGCGVTLGVVSLLVFLIVGLPLLMTGGCLSGLVRLVGSSMDMDSHEAHTSTAKAQISYFKTALTQYKLEMKRLPSTSEGLEALISNEKNKNYLDADNIPKDPWGNMYVYTCPDPKGHEFEIVSYGADGQKGGTGYNADIASWNLQHESE